MPKIALLSFLLSLTSFTAFGLETECLNPPQKNCDFYEQCLEKNISCGEEGYALSYGGKYCRKFLSIDDDLSAKGRAFAESTRSCLQKVLIPIMIQNSVARLPHYTCDNIADYAFDSHADCYTNHENSICFLNPLTDTRKIFAQLDSEELFDHRTAKQMRDVAAICMAQLAHRAGHRPTGNDSSMDQLYRFWNQNYQNWSNIE